MIPGINIITMAAIAKKSKQRFDDTDNEEVLEGMRIMSIAIIAFGSGILFLPNKFWLVKLLLVYLLA